MALDPSISLQAGRVQPLDPIGAIGQAMNLRALAQQAQSQDLQLQQQQRAMADQEALRGAYVVGQDGRIDNAATLRNLARVNPQMAQKFHFETTQNELASQKAAREAEKAQLETVGKRLELTRNGLAALGPDATYADAIRVAMSLRGQGVPVDVNEIPQDPEQLQQYLQEQRIQTDAIFRNYHEMTKPQTEIERLIQADQRWTEQNARYAEGGSVTDGVRTTVSAPPSPYRQAILRAQYGNPPDGFMWGEGGRPVPIPAVQEFELKKREKGAPKVTVNNAQEIEESKTIGKGMGEMYISLQKSARDARSKIARLDRMNQLLEGVNTGRLTPLGVELASYAQSMGINIDPKLGNKEAAAAIANEFALELRNPSGGAGMPGAMSDQDRKFLQSMSPDLSKSPQGRKLISESFKKLAQRDEEIARLARDYRRKNGRLDEGFEDVMADFSSKNPLFPTQEQIDAELARRKK